MGDGRCNLHIFPTRGLKQPHNGCWHSELYLFSTTFKVRYVLGALCCGGGRSAAAISARPLLDLGFSLFPSISEPQRNSSCRKYSLQQKAASLDACSFTFQSTLPPGLLLHGGTRGNGGGWGDGGQGGLPYSNLTFTRLEI